jgi:hypothetical protein
MIVETEPWLCRIERSDLIFVDHGQRSQSAAASHAALGRGSGSAGRGNRLRNHSATASQPLGNGLAAALDQRNQPAACIAQYVSTRSAPARRMEISVSRTVRCRSSQPRATAASTIEYSPET